MTKIKFEESTLPTSIVEPLATVGMNVNPAMDSKALFISTFTSIANFLSFTKSRDKKVGLVINDLKGNLILGGLVEFHSNEDEKENPGNWSFEFSFDPEDFAGVEPYLATDPRFQRIFGDTIFSLFKARFNDVGKIQITIESIAKSLKDWLELNAKEDEEVSIELEGTFLGTTGIENKERVFSLVPDGELKKIIKDDAGIEVAV